MSENTKNPVSNQDIFQAIQAMDHRFTAANDDILSAVNTSFTDVAVELHEIKGRLNQVENRLGNVENQMVTKDYLDDKLHDLRGDLTVIIRKEDRKVVALIDELRQTKVLSEPAAQRILALEPFPQG